MRAEVEGSASPPVLCDLRVLTSVTSVLLIRSFFAWRDEFQAASGMSSRTVERRAVSKAAMVFRPVSVSW